jgi:transcriptional regulator with XRE-family HTH domain
MHAGPVLREARRAAGLSQRALAGRAGVPQPAVARIESGGVVPRVDTLDRLLAACGRALALTIRPGAGVDRGPIRAMLDRTPDERLRVAVREARNLAQLLPSPRR